MRFLPEEVERIRLILADEAFGKMLDGLDRRYHDVWANSALTDSAAREAAYYRQLALRDVRQSLKSVLDDEKFAAKRARTT